MMSSGGFVVKCSRGVEEREVFDDTELIVDERGLLGGIGKGKRE